MKYVFSMIVLTAASVTIVDNGITPVAVPSLPNQCCAPKQPAVAARPGKRKATFMIAEFHDLGSGHDICQDAQALQQESISLATAGKVNQDSSQTAKGWNGYAKLLSQAQTSDQKLFDKEYELHQLRLNDFLFRNTMCESDFLSYVRPEPNGAQAGSGSGKTVDATKTNGTELQTLSLLQKCQTQALKNLQSLKESERHLRHHASTASNHHYI